MTAAAVLVSGGLFVLTAAPEDAEPAFASVALPQTLAPLASHGGWAFKSQWLSPDDLPYMAGSTSCAADTCAVLLEQGGRGQRTLLGTWTAGRWRVGPTAVGLSASDADLWCWTGQRCVVVDSGRDPQSHEPHVAERTGDGGRTWATSALPVQNANLLPISQSISCGAPSWCVVLNYGDYVSEAKLSVTLDGGATWTVRNLVGGSGFPTAISCRDPTHCVVVLTGKAIVEEGTTPAPVDSVARTSDGAATWTFEPLPAALQLGSPTALSCPTTTWCDIVATPDSSTEIGLPVPEIFATTGGAWSEHSLPVDLTPLTSSVRIGLACSAPKTCVLTGDVQHADQRFGNARLVGAYDEVPGRAWIDDTTDGGAHWRPAATPATVADVLSLTCSADLCAAPIGAASPPDPSSPLPRLAVGTIIASSDGGDHWSVLTPPHLPGGPAYSHLNLG